jgi:hypothetical protein
MSAERVAERYRALADIETGFKVLKNEIEMAPMFHRLPTRIIAHGAICFLALVLNRYLRQQLTVVKKAQGDCSNNSARSASAPSAKAPSAANPSPKYPPNKSNSSPSSIYHSQTRPISPSSPL